MISKTWQGYTIRKHRKGTEFPLWVRSIYKGRVVWTSDYLFAKRYSEKTAKRINTELDEGIRNGEFADIELITDEEWMRWENL